MFESSEHSGGCLNSPNSANTENQSPITINCKNVHSCIIISSFGKHSVYHYDCRLQPVNPTLNKWMTIYKAMHDDQIIQIKYPFNPN